MLNKKLLLVIGFILLGILTRIIPHPPNFTALGAIALFGGAFIYDKKFAFTIPVFIMIVSDFILGYNMSLSVYLSFIIMVFIGLYLQKKQNSLRIINAALIGSLVFFVITNFSVFLTSSLYPKSIIGLVECYTLAIPFFINTLAGNITYSLIMFYGYNAIYKRVITAS
tara:strand:- start:813 stop:1316 length:504 start_codon:yes stop_codon:yes gene_type:complete